jgi:hypothetical protein
MRKRMMALLAVAFVFCCVDGFSQTKVVGGEVALGARLGGASGITLKRYSGSNGSALEFIGAWNFGNSKLEGFGLTGLWEKLAPLTSSKQLSAEFGFGVTAIWGDEFYFGPSAVIGFDWRLKAVPITMSVDWIPTWILVNESEFVGTNVSYSIRYILNHRKYKR